jgi:hypothetical protein
MNWTDCLTMEELNFKTTYKTDEEIEKEIFGPRIVDIENEEEKYMEVEK